MSKIALVLNGFGSDEADVAKILRAGLGLEMSKITQLAGSGKPLIVKKLFDRSEPTFAELLQPVLEQLEGVGASYSAFELLDTQEFSSMDPGKLYRIDSKRLRNMIATRQASIQQQIDIGALQDGAE